MHVSRRREEICRGTGVLTSEDEYPVWQGDSSPVTVVPLLLGLGIAVGMLGTLADLRVALQVVHRNCEPGSPRLLGPINASKASTSPGSFWTRRLRPPPAVLAHPDANAGSSSSARPRYTVGRDNPDARATAQSGSRGASPTIDGICG